MENQKVLEVISNLKGRRSYEEKKSLKLGFNSLYDYIEDKLKQSAKIQEEDKKIAEDLLLKKKLSKEMPVKKQSSCSCC